MYLFLKPERIFVFTLILSFASEHALVFYIAGQYGAPAFTGVVICRRLFIFRGAPLFAALEADPDAFDPVQAGTVAAGFFAIGDPFFCVVAGAGVVLTLCADAGADAPVPFLSRQGRAAGFALVERGGIIAIGHGDSRLIRRLQNNEK